MAKKLRRFPLPKPVQRPSRYFSIEETRRIAEKFGFSTERSECYRLAKELNDAAVFYGDFKDATASPSPVGKEGKEFFKEMERRATALAECFDKLGWATVEFVWAAKTQGLDIDLESVKETLHHVADVARTAAKDVSDKGPGRDKDMALINYIARLREIYCKGTGKKDRVTRNPYAETDAEAYTGKFFSFVESCLSVVGITKSSAAVAKAIAQTLRLMGEDADFSTPTRQERKE